MSKTANFTTFVASTSATMTVPAGVAGMNVPPVDSANTALVIASNATDTAWVMLGTNAAALAGVMPGPTLPGSMVVPPGQSFLLTAGGQGSAGYAAVLGKSGGGTLTFTRGTAKDVASFTTRDDQVLV